MSIERVCVTRDGNGTFGIWDILKKPVPWLMGVHNRIVWVENEKDDPPIFDEDTAALRAPIALLCYKNNMSVQELEEEVPHGQMVPMVLDIPQWLREEDAEQEKQELQNAGIINDEEQKTTE